jgi:hypothetical protein
MYENFSLGPLEVEILGITVREHCLLRIELQNPCTRVIAVDDATLGSCQDSASNVFAEQHAIKLSPQLRFFLK